MSENQQVESEKQKVSEDQEKKNQENTAHKESKGQEGNNDKDKGGFFSLCPSILENNEEYKSYYEALDYAFKNEDIQNIAITGIYGAGKSTVWQSYVKKKNKKNIVTITLGQYESPVEREFETKIEGETEGDNDSKHDSELEQENRIERKLINQIISQISIKDTPLSKYKIKLNKSNREIYRDTRYIVLFLLSILFWLEKEWILGGLNESFKLLLLSIFSILKLESKAEFILQCLWEVHKQSSQLLFFIFCLALFIAPVYHFLLRCVREHRFLIHKIQLKGIETIINDGNIDEETVLDKDIKEIIYLLTSAKVEILVIEDLDRFNNITIFTKLRELNYMLNKHLKVNHCARTVRFVYMLRDGILKAEDRVKFFDFVLPVLPYVNSRNSESILINELKRFEFDRDDRIILATSLYIDDMRILKNIINEYHIYVKILDIIKNKLNKNKLFALMVLKNLFPCEFDELQRDNGYLYNLFHMKKEFLTNEMADIREENMNADITNLEIFLGKIQNMQQVDAYFEFVAKDKDSNILKNHYFPLIKFLVTEGYFTEDYHYYIGPLHRGGLSENDTFFMKRLIGGYKTTLTPIDAPWSIYNRLRIEDFKRTNILNETILKTILTEPDLESENDTESFKKELENKVNILMDSVDQNNNYFDLIIVLSKLEYNDIKRYVEIASQRHFKHLEAILHIVSGKLSKHDNELFFDSCYNDYGFDIREEYKKIQHYILFAILLSQSKENISRCYAAIKLSDVPEFVLYLNEKINTQNEKDILEDNPELCEDLLKSEKTSEELFGLAIKYAKNQLEVFPSEIPENKCLLLIESNLIKISKSNVHTLVDSSYSKSIDKWLELAQGDDQDDLVEFLCMENLDKIKDYLEIYLRHLKKENAIKLIDKVNGEMKIYRIAPNSTEIKKYLLLNFPVTTENIQYICKNFERFEYQQEFVNSLISHNQLQDLDKDAIKSLLTGTLVSIENKVKLLQTKIQNEVKHSELKEYIDSVDEIKDLNEVWNHKQPELNNTYKQDIGKALADNGYVKIRNDSPNLYIVLVEKKD